MSRTRIASLLLIAILGASAAWWGVPAWREARALRAIGDDDPRRRADAWLLLLDALPGEPPPALQRLDDVNERLDTAPDAALVDAADRLVRRDAWGWTRQSPALVLRELAARVQLEDIGPALDTLDTAPLDLPGDDLAPIFDTLLARPEAEIRRVALDLACAWAGPRRGDFVADLAVPAGDVALRRARLLALAFTDRADRAVHIAGGRPVLPAQPTPVLEACLLAATRAQPDDASVALAIFDRPPRDDSSAPSWVTILRGATDPRAEVALETLARNGDRNARFTLLAGTTDEAEIAESVVMTPGEPVWRRRLAAWRWPGIPGPTLAALLEETPADPDGSVFATALLAERLPDQSARVDLAGRWIGDYEDDRKRAGAILAALLDVHATVLAEAADLENEPEVRSVQQVALAALGVDVAADPREVAHRATADADGHPPPDLVACLLIAGHADALDAVTSPPPVPWPDPATTTRHRARLVARFVPHWHERLGRPIGGDTATLRFHMEMLHALATVERRRLSFDRVSRTFRYADATAGSDATAVD